MMNAELNKVLVLELLTIENVLIKTIPAIPLSNISEFQDGFPLYWLTEFGIRHRLQSCGMDTASIYLQKIKPVHLILHRC